MLSRDLQPSKADSPISISPLGKMMELSELQPLKAQGEIIRILSGS